MVALDAKCEENSQCQKLDANAICHESKECKCMDQFVNDGGVCASVLGENACNCEAKYFVEDRKYNESVIESVCTAVVERGQYCRYDEDCYQRQLSESEQSMHCTYGECNCKNGFNSLNEGACIRDDLTPTGILTSVALSNFVEFFGFFVSLAALL
ncbi:hypothetical protein EVAR_71677_1 [Eumeta japonica]|uniref:EB domain-containing protein n=1 Tax=Eumeta variegata TaxID=151549 RepID=A0A4C1SVN5_EUMVA|nr:hypothetical protein EVAR_71677_1 [Eumeta japonica]